jgi:hypothetical protein
MTMDSTPFGHDIERRREILYGTPGTVTEKANEISEIRELG